MTHVQTKEPTGDKNDEKLLLNRLERENAQKKVLHIGVVFWGYTNQYIRI